MTTALVENVHFERIIIGERKFIYAGGDLLGYCAYNRDGQAVLLRRTHPDVHEEDLLAEGERIRATELAERAKYIDKRKHLRQNN